MGIQAENGLPPTTLSTPQFEPSPTIGPRTNGGSHELALMFMLFVIGAVLVFIYLKTRNGGTGCHVDAPEKNIPSCWTGGSGTMKTSEVYLRPASMPDSVLAASGDDHQPKAIVSSSWWKSTFADDDENTRSLQLVALSPGPAVSKSGEAVYRKWKFEQCPESKYGLIYANVPSSAHGPQAKYLSCDGGSCDIAAPNNGGDAEAECLRQSSSFQFGIKTASPSGNVMIQAVSDDGYVCNSTGSVKTEKQYQPSCAWQVASAGGQKCVIL